MGKRARYARASGARSLRWSLLTQPLLGRACSGTATVRIALTPPLLYSEVGLLPLPRFMARLLRRDCTLGRAYSGAATLRRALTPARPRFEARLLQCGCVRVCACYGAAALQVCAYFGTAALRLPPQLCFGRAHSGEVTVCALAAAVRGCACSQPRPRSGARLPPRSRRGDMPRLAAAQSCGRASPAPRALT